MSDQIGSVSLTMPASLDHLRFARLLVSGMADKVGFDYDAIEDLRIAVHELGVHLLGQVDPTSDLHLRVVGRADGIEVHALAERSGLTPSAPLDALAEAIVAAVVDEFFVDAHGAMVSFRLLRRMQRAS